MKLSLCGLSEHNIYCLDRVTAGTDPAVALFPLGVCKYIFMSRIAGKKKHKHKKVPV